MHRSTKCQLGPLQTGKKVDNERNIGRPAGRDARREREQALDASLRGRCTWEPSDSLSAFAFIIYLLFFFLKYSSDLPGLGSVGPHHDLKDRQVSISFLKLKLKDKLIKKLILNLGHGKKIIEFHDMAVSTFLHIGVYYPTVNLKRNYFTLQICESDRNFGHPHPPQSLQPKGSLIDPLDH